MSPDFDELMTFLRLHLRRRALLVFMTALDDPVLAEGFVRHLDQISRQHVVIVNMRVASIWFDMFTRRQRRQRIREIVLVLGHALNRDGESRLCQSAPLGYR